MSKVYKFFIIDVIVKSITNRKRAVCFSYSDLPCTRRETSAVKNRTMVDSVNVDPKEEVAFHV
jgi:hypothetical protein